MPRYIQLSNQLPRGCEDCGSVVYDLILHDEFHLTHPNQYQDED